MKGGGAPIINKLVRGYVKNFNVSNEDLAKDLKVSKNTVDKWVSNKSVPNGKNQRSILALVQSKLDNKEVAKWLQQIQEREKNKQ